MEHGIKKIAQGSEISLGTQSGLLFRATGAREWVLQVLCSRNINEAMKIDIACSEVVFQDGDSQAKFPPWLFFDLNGDERVTCYVQNR